MACFHQFSGYRQADGTIRVGSFANRHGPRITMSCGQCYGCRLERSRQWAVRLLHEKQTSTKSAFITLTYKNSSLPPRGSLQIQDWQRFAHRLRKRLGPFRYFHCGEYGENTGRAHLHLALFGISFEEDRELIKTTPQGDELFDSPLLNHIWGKGEQNPIGDLSFKSAAYIARYIMKKQTGSKAKRHYGEIVDLGTGEILPYRKPEYVTMSLKPGIGHDWIHKYMDEVYPRDEVIINGVACRPPKYYDRQYELVDPEGYEKLLIKRQREGSKHRANNTPKRLATREEKSERDNKHFKRDGV